MEFGLQVGTLDWSELRDLAVTAESLGFDKIMMPDHIVHEGPEKQHDANAKSYDPITLAALIATATRKIRVGHLVLCKLFRHPVFTAQAIMTVDHVSGGRAFLGLGTGWTETEFRQTGIPFPEIKPRLRMLDEALTCIRSLWTQEQTTFAGEFYQLKDSILAPKPVQKPHPPIVLGGGGKGLLRLAAKHADLINVMAAVGETGYISIANTLKFDDAAFKEKVRFVRDESVKCGRERNAVKISHVVFQTMLVDSKEAGVAMATNVANMFGTTPDVVRQSPVFLIGTAEECGAELSRRAREWDLSEIVFSVQGGKAQMETIAREILPRVK